MACFCRRILIIEIIANRGEKSFDICIYERDYEFPLRWFSKRQAGKFAYEAIAQKCKRRGNLFARDQLVCKVREDELWYTSQILLVFVECLATLGSLLFSRRICSR